MLALHLTVPTNLPARTTRLLETNVQTLDIFIENDEAFREFVGDCKRNCGRAMKDAGVESTGDWVYWVDGLQAGKKRIDEGSWEECRGVLLDLAEWKKVSVLVEVEVEMEVLGE